MTRENHVSHNTADTTPITGDRGVSTPMSIIQRDTFSAHLAGTRAHAHTRPPTRCETKVSHKLADMMRKPAVRPRFGRFCPSCQRSNGTHGFGRTER